MSAHVPVLIVLAPLVGAAATPLVAFASARLAHALALAAIAASLLSAATALARTLGDGTIRYYLGGWPPPWGIEYVIDPLSGGMAVLVAGLSLIVVVYAGPCVSGGRRDIGAFYALYLLLTAGLLGMVVTGDLFNLYVFLEISSLSAYALLASGGGRSAVASYRYLLLGTVAGSFYLLGLGYLYAVTGTLNMADTAARLPAVAASPAVGVAIALITVGLGIKMAVFPLHGWLPDAYTYAPAPVTAFVAGVMTKVSAYAMLRILYFVLFSGAVTGDALRLLGWAAAAATVAGSVMALAQTDVRRILAYSSVGQMGYIVLGMSIGTPLALTGTLLHILNHAVMKSCLFLSAGGVFFRTGVTDTGGYRGAARRVPVTMAVFTIAAASMVGLPPTAGFFSKWYLMLASIEDGLWPFAIVLVASSLMSAVYLFRVVERAYFGDHADDAAPSGGMLRELPLGMLAPMILLAAAILLLGVFNQSVVTHIIAFALPASVP
jgi:multicomponent Na+:H+ antiporter subunit D